MLRFFCIALLLSGPLLADTVFLRSGGRVEGRIIAQSASHVRILFRNGQTLTLGKEKILRIGYGPVKPEKRPAAPPENRPRTNVLEERQFFDFFRRRKRPVDLQPEAGQVRAPGLDLRTPVVPPPAAPLLEGARAQAPATPSDPFNGKFGLELYGSNGNYSSMLERAVDGLSDFENLYRRAFQTGSANFYEVRSGWKYTEESRPGVRGFLDYQNFRAELEISTGKSRPSFKTYTLYEGGNPGDRLETAKLNKLTRSEALLRLGYTFKAGDFSLRPFVGAQERRIESRIHSGSLNKSSMQLSGGIPELWDYITDLDRSHRVHAKGITAGFFAGWRYQDFGFELTPEYHQMSGDYSYLNRSQLLVVEEVPRQIQIKLDSKADPIYDQAFVESRHESQLLLKGYMITALSRYYLSESHSIFLQLRGQNLLVEHKDNRVTQFVLTKSGEVLQRDTNDIMRYIALEKTIGKMVKSNDRAESVALGIAFYF